MLLSFLPIIIRITIISVALYCTPQTASDLENRLTKEKYKIESLLFEVNFPIVEHRPSLYPSL